jgi:hypothetical protein
MNLAINCATMLRSLRAKKAKIKELYLTFRLSKQDLACNSSAGNSTVAR